MRKVKITEFKTKRINKFTGAKIADYYNKSLCFEDQDPNDPKNCTLENSFMSKDGVFMGDYAKGWWYFKNNMIVCNDYPHGVGIVLKQRADKMKDFDIAKINLDKDIKGFYGYSHRGGNLFKIGSRLFKENYKPKKEDYTEKEWRKFEKDYKSYLAREIKEGYYDNEEQAKKSCRMSDVIPFSMRGSKIIKNWNEAKKAAINMSKYLG